MKLAVLAPVVLALSFPVLAQTPPPPTETPSTYIGAGAGYNGSTTPNLNVELAFAQLISHGIWSYTAADYISARTKPFSVTSTLRSGILMEIHRWGGFMIGEEVAAGAAAVPGGVVGSVGTGGVVMYRRPSGFTIGLDVREVKNAGFNWTPAANVMIGASW